MFFRSVQLPLALVIALLTKGANIVYHQVYTQLQQKRYAATPNYGLQLYCSHDFYSTLMCAGIHKFRQNKTIFLFTLLKSSTYFKLTNTIQ